LEGCYDSEGNVDNKRLRIRFMGKKKEYVNMVIYTLNKLNIQHTLNQDKHKIWWVRICGQECFKFHKLIHFSIKYKEENLKNGIKEFYKKVKYEIKKRQETLILKEKEWCNKYNLTKNQYYRHKRSHKKLKYTSFFRNCNMKYYTQRLRVGKTYAELVGTEKAKLWRKKQRLAQLGIKNHFFGKKHSEKSKRKIGIKSIGRKTMLGKKMSKSARKKISITRLKMKEKQGYLVSPQAREKISKRMKELWQNPEYLKKMKERN